MADKIENKDLFAKDAFSKTQKDVEDLIGVLDELNKTLVDLSKAQKKILNSEDGKTFESLKNINKAVDTLNTAEQESTKILKEKLKLENKLAQAKNEDAKINTELKVLIQEQNKLNKEAAKDALGLTDAYQKQSKRLNELRKEFKSLVLVEGQSSKAAKKLQKEIKALDKELKDVDASAGQFQRNVGNYPDSFGKAANSILGVAAAAVTAQGAFNGVKGSLESTEAGSEAVRKVTSKLSGGFKVVQNVVANAALDFFNFASSVAKGEKELTQIDGVFDNTADAASNIVDKTLKAADGNEKLTEKIIALEKASRPLEVRLSSLNGLIEQQAIIAGDSTRSFDEIAGAVLKGQDLQIKRARINISLAQTELEISKERVRLANEAGGAGVDLLDQETAAITKLIDAENQLKNEILENEKELRQVKQDRLEIDLDILIDGFDNQKTINERIIANEKETLETRAALLDKTNKLAEESFRGQKEVLADLSNAGLNIDDLLLLDATQLAKQIQLLGQSEIINTRTLEVIRERRIVLQDLEEAQSDLNESQSEGLELTKDIEAQEDALFKIITSGGKATTEVLENLEEERIQNQISNIEERLKNVKEGSVEELRLRQQLNDLLIKQAEKQSKKEEDAEKKRVEKAEQLEKERIEKQKELTAAAIEVLADLVNEGFEKRIAAIDDQLSKTGENIDRLRDKAQEGQLDSQESLAFEQKQELELQRQKEREQKRQERTQAFFAVLSSFNSNDGNLPKTIADISVLKALAGGLTAFDGVDDTGGRGDLDGKGGKAWILHPNEQVWSKKDRGEVGFRSREEMKDIVKMYDNGMLTDIMKYDKSNELINTNAFALNGMGNSQIVSKLDELNKSIKSIQPITGSVEIDEAKKVIQYTYKKGNRVTKEISKLY